jgi:hypothetical protein
MTHKRRVTGVRSCLISHAREIISETKTAFGAFSDSGNGTISETKTAFGALSDAGHGTYQDLPHFHNAILLKVQA